MNVKVAIPSVAPGGLDALVEQHFGHADLFTLVELKDGAIKAVDTLQNAPHEHGGCMMPVNMLASAGVKALLAGGMGMRPLQGFLSQGIVVYRITGGATVRDALEAFMKGQLPMFGQDSVCQGSGHCGSHGNRPLGRY